MNFCPEGGALLEWKKALPHTTERHGPIRKEGIRSGHLAFEEVIRIFPGDGPATFYLNASRDYSVIPPDPDWDGVIKLTAK